MSPRSSLRFSVCSVPVLLFGWLLCGGAESLHADESNHPATRWALDAGFGVRLWENTNRTREEIEYLDQARTGLVLGFEAAVFPWNDLGFGVAVATFTASASDSSMTYPDDSQRAAQDSYYIQYFAPALCLKRSFADGRFLVSGQAGAGMFFYRNESNEGPFPGITDAFAPGAHASVSLDYRVWSRFAIGGGLRALYGKTPHLNYNAIDADLPPVSLSRIDIAAGVRYYP
jgi:hypothetical protein